MSHLAITLKRLLLLLVVLPYFILPSVSACTRALWVNDQNVVVGRTMDWNGEMKSNLWVFPRGIEREGFADVNSMRWKSKYGSIVTNAHDAIATDGMNEKGFAAHIFWLIESDYGQRNESLPGMSVLMWEQYYLDNFATVDEAVRSTEGSPFQLEPFALEEPMSLHLVIEDASGDSAIFEYIDGQLHIYHDRSYVAVTNSPTFDKQLVNLRGYKGFGGDNALPGTTESTDRFVRAAYYALHLPQPTSSRDAIAKILSVTSNTAMPSQELSAERTWASRTIWHTALDLTHRIYYFMSTDTHSLIWANLDKFNLKEGAPILKLDLVNQDNLAGDITNKFKSGFLIKSPKVR
jgi:penicillin V acylase-like amidase (Ntn superfamily)